MISVIIQTTPTIDTGSKTDIISLFIQYGIPGLVIAALLLGFLWAKPAVDTLIKDKAKAEEQRDKLLEVYEEKLLPALTESINITKELKPLLQDVVATLTLAKDQINQGRVDAKRNRL